MTNRYAGSDAVQVITAKSYCVEEAVQKILRGNGTKWKNDALVNPKTALHYSGLCHCVSGLSRLVQLKFFALSSCSCYYYFVNGCVAVRENEFLLRPILIYSQRNIFCFVFRVLYFARRK